VWVLCVLLHLLTCLFVLVLIIGCIGARLQEELAALAKAGMNDPMRGKDNAGTGRSANFQSKLAT
jgi:hypothetical protein